MGLPYCELSSCPPHRARNPTPGLRDLQSATLRARELWSHCHRRNWDVNAIALSVAVAYAGCVVAMVWLHGTLYINLMEARNLANDSNISLVPKRLPGRMGSGDGTKMGRMFAKAANATESAIGSAP